MISCLSSPRELASAIPLMKVATRISIAAAAAIDVELEIPCQLAENKTHRGVFPERNKMARIRESCLTPCLAGYIISSRVEEISLHGECTRLHA